MDNGYLFFMCGLFTLLPKKALNLKLLITPFDLRNVILKSYVNLYGNPLVPRRKKILSGGRQIYSYVAAARHIVMW